ncbi:hypothetical protein ACTJKN_26720 [Pedobacter sp. 22163]|uniref:hypothetical protein n=1 Tax=Pedobacter sp. 22163 TaxID=3453883 RepID=UPI003F842DE8
MRGVLNVFYDYFDGETKSFAFYTSCLAYLVTFITLYSIRNKEWRMIRIDIPFKYKMLLPFLYLISAVIGYTRAFNIDVGIQSGIFAILFSVLILTSKDKKFELTSILHILFLIFVILSGERVDALLALILHFLIGERNNTRKVSLWKVIPIVIGMFLFAIFIDAQRAGQAFNFPFVVSSLISQQTAVDVCYVYLTGVDYFIAKGTNSALMFNTVFGALPGKYGGVLSDYNYSIFLSKNVMTNPGGGLYYTEGLLIAGIPGLIFIVFVWSLFIKFVYKRRTQIFTLIFILIVVMQLRVQWYGVIYIYKILLLIFFTSLLRKMLIKIYKKKTLHGISRLEN